MGRTVQNLNPHSPLGRTSYFSPLGVERLPATRPSRRFVTQIFGLVGAGFGLPLGWGRGVLFFDALLELPLLVRSAIGEKEDKGTDGYYRQG